MHQPRDRSPGRPVQGWLAGSADAHYAAAWAKRLLVPCDRAVDISASRRHQVRTTRAIRVKTTSITTLNRANMRSRVSSLATSSGPSSASSTSLYIQPLTLLTHLMLTYPLSQDYRR